MFGDIDRGSEDPFFYAMIPERIKISDNFLEYLKSSEYWLLSEDNWNENSIPDKDPYHQTSAEKLQHILDRGIRLDVPANSRLEGYRKDGYQTDDSTDDEEKDIRKLLKGKSLIARLASKFKDCVNMPLIVYYPPMGYIGWHSNYRVTGPSLLFTWSETGDGYLRYRNPYTKEVETIYDLKGWDCKRVCWEPDPENEVWHSAMTECKRVSFAFLFSSFDDLDEAIKNM